MLQEICIWGGVKKCAYPLGMCGHFWTNSITFFTSFFVVIAITVIEQKTQSN